MSIFSRLPCSLFPLTTCHSSHGFLGRTKLFVNSGAAQKQPPAPIHIYLYGKHQAREVTELAYPSWNNLEKHEGLLVFKTWQAMASYGKLENPLDMLRLRRDPSWMRLQVNSLLAIKSLVQYP